MDKVIQTKKNSTKKIALWSIPVLLVVTIVFMNLTRKKEVNLTSDEISIRSVIKGDFEDVLLVNSIVEPTTSVLVNVIQGGAVAEIYTESGTVVEKGTPLLRVYNPNAELSYLTQETAMIEQINNLRNIRVSIKNQQLNLNQQLIGIDNDFKNATRQYKLDTTLYKKGVIAKNDYLKSSQEFQFQKERKEVIKQSVAEEKKSRNVQLARINSSIANMQKSLELLRKNKENFIVKAPSTGLLSSFNPVLGKNYNQGEPIGKIDVLGGYKLVAKVDEFYISKLQEGIKGEVTITNKKENVMLSKIHPEVENGQFKIEVKFEKDSLTEAVKRGMSLKSKLFLSNNKKALLLPKGQFYQTTNGKWIFVLNSENKAVKRTITIGRENPFYYEVTDGLQEGDKVITSSYDDFKEIELINIK